MRILTTTDGVYTGHLLTGSILRGACFYCNRYPLVAGLP